MSGTSDTDSSLSSHKNSDFKINKLNLFKINPKKTFTITANMNKQRNTLGFPRKRITRKWLC